MFLDEEMVAGTRPDMVFQEKPDLLDKLLSEFAKEVRRCKDWFYAIVVDGHEFFVVDNGDQWLHSQARQRVLGHEGELETRLSRPFSAGRAKRGRV